MTAHSRRLGRIHAHLSRSDAAATAAAAPKVKGEGGTLGVKAEGQAEYGMTDEQRFFFDLKGWICLPAVLSPAECAEIMEEIDGQMANGGFNIWESSKALQLIDHPAVVPILTDLLAEPSFVGDDAYAFRCEGSFTTIRPPGWDVSERGDNGLPHVVRPPQQANAMRYQVAGNKIFSGLTRVVWELEECVAGQGNTSFLSGSHKAHFPYGGPNDYAPNIGGSPWEDNMRAAMEDYSCPAGSVVIFTESLIHAANDWTNPKNRRCAVFNCCASPSTSPCGPSSDPASAGRQLGVGSVAPHERAARAGRADGPDEAISLQRRLAVGSGREPRILRGQPRLRLCSEAITVIHFICPSPAAQSPRCSALARSEPPPSAPESLAETPPPRACPP